MFRSKIEELATKPVIALSPDDTLQSAVDLMHERNFSCVPVLDSGIPVGIVTERGIIEMIADAGDALLRQPLGEVMSTPVITIEHDMHVYEALHIFVQKKIRHLVVSNGNKKAIGLITLSDIVSHVGHDLMVEFHEVSHYMSRIVFSVEKEMPLRHAMNEMACRKISCLIVTEEKQPIGILSERDIIHLMADKQDLNKMEVAQIMRTPVAMVDESTQVYEVTRLMRTKNIRRIVVVDQNGHICGLVTQTNIMQGLESSYIKILKQVILEKESRIESTAQERDELFQYLITILNSAIDMAIVATDKDFTIIYYNSCAEEILNYPAELAIGASVQEIHEQQGIEPSRFQQIMENVRRQGSYSFTYANEVNEQTRHFQARLSAINSASKTQPLGYVFLVQDITDRKRAEDNMRYLAYHDILTGLPNRVTFNERLELELSHAEREKGRLAVMLVDLDKFKWVNDTYGHYSGDLLLSGVAKRLSKALRKSDTVARIGGDEFIVIVPNFVQDEHAVCIAKKLIKAMQEPFNLKGVKHQARISLGIAYYPEHGTTVKQLVDHADRAMYQAKHTGRDNEQSNMAVYTPESEPS